MRSIRNAFMVMNANIALPISRHALTLSIGVATGIAICLKHMHLACNDHGYAWEPLAIINLILAVIVLFPLHLLMRI